jgi:hypothetical protein
MAEKRQLELYLLRLVPHAVRDDFMTVGVVLVEAGGGFADVRFTRDWKRVECFAPEIEAEHLERLEAAVRGQLENVRSREDLLKLLEQGFGPEFDVGPVKAVEARDPAAEMQLLERDYLAATQPVERARRTGRMEIVSRMEEAFAGAGVMGLLQRNLDMTEFLGKNDPFHVDFGFRVGKSLRMFQALALSSSREPAMTLVYRYCRIQEAARKQDQEALLTAIIREDAIRAKREVAFGIAMMKSQEIQVRDMGEMTAVAEEVRREMGA